MHVSPSKSALKDIAAQYARSRRYTQINLAILTHYSYNVFLLFSSHHRTAMQNNSPERQTLDLEFAAAESRKRDAVKAKLAAFEAKLDSIRSCTEPEILKAEEKNLRGGDKRLRQAIKRQLLSIERAQRLRHAAAKALEDLAAFCASPDQPMNILAEIDLAWEACRSSVQDPGLVQAFEQARQSAREQIRAKAGASQNENRWRGEANALAADILALRRGLSEPAPDYSGISARLSLACAGARNALDALPETPLSELTEKARAELASALRSGSACAQRAALAGSALADLDIAYPTAAAQAKTQSRQNDAPQHTRSPCQSDEQACCAPGQCAQGACATESCEAACQSAEKSSCAPGQSSQGACAAESGEAACQSDEPARCAPGQCAQGACAAESGEAACQSNEPARCAPGQCAQGACAAESGEAACQSDEPARCAPGQCAQGACAAESGEAACQSADISCSAGQCGQGACAAESCDGAGQCAEKSCSAGQCGQGACAAESGEAACQSAEKSCSAGQCGQGACAAESGEAACQSAENSCRANPEHGEQRAKALADAEAQRAKAFREQEIRREAQERLDASAEALAALAPAGDDPVAQGLETLIRATAKQAARRKAAAAKALADAKNAQRKASRQELFKQLRIKLESAGALIDNGSLSEACKAVAACAKTLSKDSGSEPELESLRELKAGLVRSLTELRSWEEWSARQARESCLRDAESLARTLGPDHNGASPKIKIQELFEKAAEISRRWSQIGKHNLEADQDIAGSFDIAMQIVNAPLERERGRLKAAREENAAKRQAAIDAANSAPLPEVLDAASASALAKALSELNAAWRALGPAEHALPKDKAPALLQSYESACARLRGPLDAWRAQGAARRAELISQAQALASGPVPARLSDKIKALGEAWSQASKSCHLGQKQECELWCAFKSATDAAWDSLRAQTKEASRAKRESQATLDKALCLLSEACAAETEQAAADLIAQAKALEQALRPGGGRLPESYDRAARKAQEARSRFARAAREAQALELAKALLAGEASAQALYEASGLRKSLPKPVRAAVERRLAGQTACPLGQEREQTAVAKLEAIFGLGAGAPSEKSPGASQAKLNALKDLFDSRRSSTAPAADATFAEFIGFAVPCERFERIVAAAFLRPEKLA